MSEARSIEQRLSVGQLLWYVPTNRRGASPYAVTVKKVGRKWAEIEGGERISLLDLCADGGQYTSPGKCYLSKEAYEEELALYQAWQTFRRTVDVHGRPPDGVTMNQIENARRSLFKDSK